MPENRDEGWSLLNDGALWKKAIWYADSKAKQQANAFVAQLQASVGPVDALQGLLLDRIAAGYIRKVHLIEVQSATLQKAKNNIDSTDVMKTSSLTANHCLSLSWSANLLRYESLLDQSFHRDLILLLELKQAAPAAPALNAKKPPKSDRGQIEDQVNSTVAAQAIAASTVTKLSPVAPECEDEKSAEERNFGRVVLD